MLAPIDIDKKNFKSGFGYKKRDVDAFLSEVYEDYSKLYDENIEYKDKIAVLNDGLQYYKSIEKTLQKALVLAQKTADDHHADAIKRAKSIEMEARIKSDKIVKDALKELNKIKNRVSELMNKYEVYKAQYKNLVASQLEILDGDSFNFSLSEINNIFLEEEQALSEFFNLRHEDGVVCEEGISAKEKLSVQPVEIEDSSEAKSLNEESEESVDFHEE